MWVPIFVEGAFRGLVRGPAVRLTVASAELRPPMLAVEKSAEGVIPHILV